MQAMSQFVRMPRATSPRMTKRQLVEALRQSEAKQVVLAAENDRLRHALEIERANNLFQVPRRSN